MKVRRKLKTLFTHPRRVIWKYFYPFWCKLFNIPPPPYGEDYDHHWGYTSFNGKTVLDLGADYGSTAHFSCPEERRGLLPLRAIPPGLLS